MLVPIDLLESGPMRTTGTGRSENFNFQPAAAAFIQSRQSAWPCERQQRCKR